MKNFNILLCAFFILLSQLALAQNDVLIQAKDTIPILEEARSPVVSGNNGILVSIGAASFQMDDMKYLQDVMLDNYPVEGKITSSFPMYFIVSLYGTRQVRPNLRIGIGYSHTSTGARSNYTDYSGSMETNITAVSHRLGIFTSYRIAGIDPWDFSAFGRLDINMSRIELLNSIYVLGYADGYYKKYYAASPNISAGLELLYHFNQVSVGVEGGYLVDVPGELMEKEPDIKFTDPNDGSRVLQSNWSGIRTAFKIILWLDM